MGAFTLPTRRNSTSLLANLFRLVETVAVWATSCKFRTHRTDVFGTSLRFLQVKSADYFDRYNGEVRRPGSQEQYGYSRQHLNGL